MSYGSHNRKYNLQNQPLHLYTNGNRCCMIYQSVFHLCLVLQHCEQPNSSIIHQRNFLDLLIFTFHDIKMLISFNNSKLFHNQIYLSHSLILQESLLDLVQLKAAVRWPYQHLCPRSFVLWQNVTFQVDWVAAVIALFEGPVFAQHVERLELFEDKFSAGDQQFYRFGVGDFAVLDKRSFGLGTKEVITLWVIFTHVKQLQNHIEILITRLNSTLHWYPWWHNMNESNKNIQSSASIVPLRNAQEHSQMLHKILIKNTADRNNH